MIAELGFRVDPGLIEKSLAALWQTDESSTKVVTRAAIWSLIVHASDDEGIALATSVLNEVAVAVPNRAIMVCSEQSGPSELGTWVSASCHLVGGGKQVCSEQISIVAGGDRLQHVGSIVRALLIPDMPVAAWWIGDLPDDDDTYIRDLLETADRIIVDSREFNRPEDLDLLASLGHQTHTTPADLSWIRLVAWRNATAAIFDQPAMGARLGSIRALRVVIAAPHDNWFGSTMEGLYYAAWLSVQLVRMGASAPEVVIQRSGKSDGRGHLLEVDLELSEGVRVTIASVPAIGAILSRVQGTNDGIPVVTRISARRIGDLVGRQLSYHAEDRLFGRVLPEASRIAKLGGGW